MKLPLTPVIVHTVYLTQLRECVQPLDANDPNQRQTLERGSGIVGCAVTEDWLARFDTACRTMRELAMEAASQPQYKIVRVTRLKFGDEIVTDTEHPSRAI